MLSLAASDVPHASGRELPPPQYPWHETNFYNILGGSGQTKPDPSKKAQLQGSQPSCAVILNLLAEHSKSSLYVIALLSPTRPKVIGECALRALKVIVPHIVSLLILGQ